MKPQMFVETTTFKFNYVETSAFVEISMFVETSTFCNWIFNFCWNFNFWLKLQLFLKLDFCSTSLHLSVETGNTSKKAPVEISICVVETFELWTVDTWMETICSHIAICLLLSPDETFSQYYFPLLFFIVNCKEGKLAKWKYLSE